MSLLDPLTDILKKKYPDFHAALELIENVKTFQKKSTAHINKGKEEIAATFRSYEEKVKEYKQLIKYLEEMHKEL